MQDVMLIFDLGKSNKKMLVYDENLQLLQQSQTMIPEKEEASGYLVDDVPAIWQWMAQEVETLHRSRQFRLRAMNITTFGATIAHLNEGGALAVPVISYAHDPGEQVDRAFREWMENLPGGFARHATPPLPQFLNVGKQLFYLRRRQPEIANRIHTSLFLPQYFVYKLSGQKLTEPTSYGCHTGLWDFQQMRPSAAALSGLDWREKMPPLALPAETAFPLAGELATQLNPDAPIWVGSGLHDSSSALVPYLLALKEGFALISTGTWIIILNPDARFRLTEEDLQRDRLYYLTPDARPVRAARLFAGREHERQLQRIEKHFGKKPDTQHQDIERFLPEFFAETRPRGLEPEVLPGSGPFPNRPAGEWDLSAFAHAEEAYARLCLDLAVLTDYCFSEVASEKTQRVVIDGGFAKNPWFVKVLAMLMQPRQVFTAEVPQATSLGAAMLIQPHWSGAPIDADAVLNLRPVAAKPLPGLRVYAEHFLARWESLEAQHRNTQQGAQT